jgi:zinc protease
LDYFWSCAKWGVLLRSTITFLHMLNRSQAPTIANLHHLELPPIQKIKLDNGIPVFVVSMGTQEVVKVEVVFNAGRPYESKPMIARATAALLREGTVNLSSAELAEKLDFYGSSVSSPFHMDTVNLSKHFAQVLPVLADIIKNPTFPEHELQAFIQRSQQHLQVDLSKNDVVAYREFTAQLYGEDHPYGYNSSAESYATIQRSDLLDHAQRCFTAGNAGIILSGKITPEIIDLLNAQLGQGLPQGEWLQAKWPKPQSNPQKSRIERSNSLQSAIRIGFRAFNRHHPDYHAFSLLNTALGGYFGSRLMSNIREEKGYTYNIYSNLDVMRFDGYFYVGTEVGGEFEADTLKQIYYEMERLREAPLEEEEWEMLRNYLMGNYLGVLDGPFNVAEIVRILWSENLPLSYFSEAVEAVNNTSLAQMQELARKYFVPENMWEVIVG